MTTLRELAKDFAAGSLQEELYRKQRSEFINGVLANEVPLPDNEYLAPIMPKKEEALDITERRTEKSKTSTEKTQPSRQAPGIIQQNKWILGGGIAVILVAIVTILIFSSGDTAQQPVTSDSTPAPAENIVAIQAETAAGKILIQDFLSDNNWTEARLGRLLADWRALGEKEKETTRNSTESGLLANAIYKQLLNQRALSGLSEQDNTLTRQYQLVSLAQEFDIQDPRLTVQVQTPQIQIQEPPQVETETLLAPSAEADTTTEEMKISSEIPAATVIAVIEPADIVTAEPATETIEIEEQPAVDESRENIIETPVVNELAATDIKDETEVAEKPAPVPAAEATRTVSSNNSSACKPSLVNSRRPYCRDVIEGIGNGPTMVVIRPGEFLMGGEESSEQPAHNVTISAPFAMSVHEITLGEYQQFCQETNTACPPQPWAGKDYPVVNVSWHDAVAYTNWLSIKTGQQYRLPSESEWEYAARAGTTTTYPSGDDIDITFAIFSYQKELTAPLPKTDRSINRNKFRLYHIVGNVREWVQDTWYQNYDGAPVDGSARSGVGNPDRVVRGGSYTDSSSDLRSGARLKQAADATDNYTGFRVIQEI